MSVSKSTLRRNLAKNVARSESAALTDLSNGYSDGEPNMSHAHAVLKQYRERSTVFREEYLQQLTTKSRSFLSEHRRKRLNSARTDALAESMMQVVDLVYATIEPYAAELNRALGYSELTVSSTSPCTVTEHLIFDAHRQPLKSITTYRTRISTCRLSVVVRGCVDRIDFFMLPVEHVMGLTKIEQEHAPLMTFTAQLEDGKIDWHVEGKDLTPERLERYSLLLFDHLIEETRIDMDRREAS
ncbi:MAG TPA: hypothetical protein V6C72_11340 [Chroococcales cyanobacterium]